MKSIIRIFFIVFPLVVLSQTINDSLMNAKIVAESKLILENHKIADSALKVKAKKELNLVQKIAKLEWLLTKLSIKKSNNDNEKVKSRSKKDSSILLSEAVKPDEYEVYVIDDRYKIEFVPRKWTGRIFSKTDFKVKISEIKEK